VLAANVGGLKTVVAHNETGVLVDGHDPIVWAGEINKLLQNPKTRDAMSLKATERAKQFSWESTVKNLQAVYQAALATEQTAPVRISAV
jgi:D-inositol-3-phosphate glycosyltransferase